MKRLLSPFFVLLVVILVVSAAVWARTNNPENGKLDFFSKSNASTDSLSPVAPLFGFNKLPEKYWPYDANVDERISADELAVAVNDYTQQESPYTKEELTAFIDYYFDQLPE